MPNHMDDVLLHAMDGSELSRVRTEFNQLRILPIVSPLSSTTEQQVFWPWPLWQSFFAGASSGAHTDVASPGCTVRLPNNQSLLGSRGAGIVMESYGFQVSEYPLHRS